VSESRSQRAGARRLPPEFLQPAQPALPQAVHSTARSNVIVTSHGLCVCELGCVQRLSARRVRLGMAAAAEVELSPTTIWPGDWPWDDVAQPGPEGIAEARRKMLRVPMASGAPGAPLLPWEYQVRARGRAVLTWPRPSLGLL
jgi:hypothetical protein